MQIRNNANETQMLFTVSKMQMIFGAWGTQSNANKEYFKWNTDLSTISKMQIISRAWETLSYANKEYCQWNTDFIFSQ